MTPGPSTRGPALPCLAIALVLLSLLGPVRASAELPVIDLADVTSLDGRWAFRFGDEPSWAAVDAPDEDWERLQVPGTWGRQGHRGRSGFAWYRHRVELRGEALAEARAGRLALRFRNVDSAYALYLGGQHVWTNGAFPPDPAVAYDRHAVVPIPATAIEADAGLTIAVRVWKSPVKRATQGGIATGPVEIGRVDLLRTAFFYADLTYLALFILFALAGSYHLYLFWRRVALREYLWFGCVALLFATSVFGRTQMKYRVLDDFTIWKNIEYTAIYLAPVAFLEFVFALFSKPVPKVARVLQVACAGAALGTALTPISFNIALLTTFEVAMLAMLVGILWLVFREYRAGHPQAQTLGLAFLVLFIAVVNDMLRDQALMQTAQLMPLGFGLFTMQMAAGLADRFARTYRDLESLNADLENRVLAQTYDLEDRAVELETKNKELEDAYRQLRESSLIDPLTGLRNRRFYQEHIAFDVARVVRDYEMAIAAGRTPDPSKASLVFALIDVDHFKRVNDQHGHSAGDEALAKMARVLGKVCRSSDYLIRWGGEEFLIVSRFVDRAGAATLAERIRAAVEQEVFVLGSGLQARLTASVGFACFPLHESAPTAVSEETVLEIADACLYQVKESGRNGWIGALSAKGEPDPSTRYGRRAAWPPEGLDVVRSDGEG